MNLLFREYRRITIIPLTAIGLAVFYLVVYLPLDRKAKGYDEPLRRAWRALAADIGRTNATAIDFLRLTNQLVETRQALAGVETTRQRAAERLEIPPLLRERLNAPFQLVEYENERSYELDALLQLARKQQVTVDPSVYASFPELTADVTQPELLWASLPFIKGLLTSAFNAKVTAVHSLEVPVVLTKLPATNALLILDQIPIQMEFTGPAQSVLNLLQSLPLRAPELKAVGLPESPPDKLPLFIDRFIIKKQSPEKPDEMRVWLRVIGFILRE